MRVEIITGRERRRRYAVNEKLALVDATMRPGMTVSAIARLHGVSPSLLFKWRQLMSQDGQVAVKADEDVVAASRARYLEQRVRELERLLGRKTMEVEVLKEALAVALEKKPRLAWRAARVAFGVGSACGQPPTTRVYGVTPKRRR